MIAHGSNTVFIGGLPAARVGDQTAHAACAGMVIPAPVGQVISGYPIHIAVVDLTIPLVQAAPARAGGPRILQLLRRLNQPPPTVVIRPRQPIARDSARGLAAALREGAFAVLDRPIQLETMLEVMRRILRKHYADVWPTS